MRFGRRYLIASLPLPHFCGASRGPETDLLDVASRPSPLVLRLTALKVVGDAVVNHSAAVPIPVLVGVAWLARHRVLFSSEVEAA